MKAFQSWCALNRTAELPAEPADVARFVKDNADQGMAKVFALLGQISRAHLALGIDDPTNTPAVAAAIASIGGTVDAPRSWSSEMKERFKTLPFDIQAYILQRDIERDVALRAAQNKAAESSKKELAA